MHLDWFNARLEAELKTYANKSPDEEVGGFVVLNSSGCYELVSAVNEMHSDHKAHAIMIGGLQYMKAYKQGQIVAFFHSHIKDFDEHPSDMDKQSSEHFDLPFIIYSLKTQKFSIYNAQN